MGARSSGVNAFFAVVALLIGATLSHGQLVETDGDLADRPVAAVRVEGVDEPGQRLVRNNLRIAVGDPYDAVEVREDVRRLYELGRFDGVSASAELLTDGTVAVTFVVEPTPPIVSIETQGNKVLSDAELAAVVRLVPQGPRSEFLIERAVRDIKTLYRQRGYYLTDVTVDRKALDAEGRLIFRIIEGPRVRVRAVEFSGVEAMDVKQVRAEVKTRTHIFLLRQGVLDGEVIALDKAAIDRFYRERGYLDVRVGHTVELSPDNREAKVTFEVLEGEPYILGGVRAERFDGRVLEVFTPEQIAALIPLKVGDAYSADRVRRAQATIEEAYGALGYLDVRVAAVEERSGPGREADIVFEIDEGEFALVGPTQINGNFLTKDKVIRRQIRVRPGRPYDTAALERSRQELLRTRLFNDVRITVQDPDPDTILYRDLLVEVKERNTGSVNFGVAVGSDSGVFGEISLNQSNFDVADTPESWQELITGRAFRGAGQSFSMVFRPGNEIFEYSVSLTEPHIFESDVSLSVSGAYRQRQYSDYDEERLTAAFGLSRRLGDVWQLGGRFRGERVELTDIAPFVPVDVFEDAGPDNLNSLGVTLTRTTITTITRPGEGSRLELGLDNFGLLGGDFDFWRAEADYSVFFTLDEDFLGRASTLRLNGRVGYLFGDDRPPTYERFYLGGRTFRGFDFRTVSPKGIRADTGMLGDDPIGGEWLLFLGAQYEFPLFEEAVTGVAFVDTGTVSNDPGFGEYRASVGLGVRLYIAAFGPVPIAFDFGFPIQDQEGDERQTLTFSAELPF